MSSDQATIALYEIGNVRGQLHAAQELLLRVIGDDAPQAGSDLRVDMNFRALNLAKSKLNLLSPERIGELAGPEVAAAYTDFQAAFRGIDDVYGLATGPGRTDERADDLQVTLAGVASVAIHHLRAFYHGTRDLEIPDFDAYIGAVERKSAALRGISRSEDAKATAPDARSPTPRIRMTLDGEETARRTRSLLGFAFGGLARTYGILKGEHGRHTGMIAFAELSGMWPHLTVRAGSLARRGAQDDSALTFHAEATRDLVDVLQEEFQKAVGRGGISDEDRERLAAKVLDCVGQVGGRLRAVEALADERGYDILPEAAGQAGPRP